MKKTLFVLMMLFPFLVGYSQEYPKREMRAAWIATVENIDWPSSKGLTTEQQKSEMIEILDQVKAYNMNAVVFQIRPDADALYFSKLEPWSEWITGKQGVAPEPYYDPLQFTIDECHKRGLDIHVWLNPYRAIQSVEKTVAAENHVTKTHPEWMLTYGSKVYFDPGLTEARDHVARVVSDLVRRYDIDAIHFDDYFYPYRIAKIDFPDDNSFKNNRGTFNENQKDDWRRNNVDLIIKQLHDSIKSIKPWVEFGISPFGVWRNKKVDPQGSDTRAGVSNYDDLYADILKWQKEKWIDYVTPQLYWYIGKEVADYAILAKWWSDNTYGCQLYIGQAPYLIDPNSKDKSWQSSEELIRQLELNRTLPNIKGSMFFSAKFLKKNPMKMKENLKEKFYRFQALTPSNNQVQPILPGDPSDAKILENRKSITLRWEKSDHNELFVIYQFPKKGKIDFGNPKHILTTTSENMINFERNRKNKSSRYFYFVTAISPSHTESLPVNFSKNKK